MSEPIQHLIIVDGPESGREINIPETGARMGRVNGNDVVFKDPSMSRFQCRLFFKDQQLWINDLGSTNESLVNDKPVQEAPLYVGDHIILGQTVIKVVNNVSATADGPTSALILARTKEAAAAPPPAPAPAAAPANPAEAPAAGTQPGSVVLAEDGSIDLGLKIDEDALEQRPEGKGAPKALWVAVIVFALAATGAVIFKVTQSGNVSRIGPVAAATPGHLAIYYEKIVANQDNVFRYEMKLEDNKISVTIDDINNNMHDVLPPQGVNPEIVLKLKNDIEASGFFRLEENYAGISDRIYDVKDLTVISGSKVHRCRVKNRVPPQVFRSIVDKVESFSLTETGLHIHAKTPEELQDLAKHAYEMARKLEDEINVREENLYDSIQQYRQVELNLRTIDPKPDIYREAIIKQENLKRDLSEKLKDQMFQADRAITLREWEAAARHLRTIKKMMPDRGNETHLEADRKLLAVERNLE